MMSNRKATGKTARRGAELVQRSRAAILNALDVVESKGKLISEILAEEFENNPIKFMELASKFAPKEIADVTDQYKADNLTDDELADIAAGRSQGAVETPESADSVH